MTEWFDALRYRLWTRWDWRMRQRALKRDNRRRRRHTYAAAWHNSAWTRANARRDRESWVRRTVGHG